MNCNIYICYHNNKPQINSDVLFPLEAQISTDDNISAKNKYFCELTAMYWIWKNVTADVVGLFHYRRFLNLKTHQTRIHNINEKTINKLGLTEDRINQLMQKYDIILPVLRPKKIKQSSPTIYEYYSNHHYKEDLDITLDIISTKYQHMEKFATSAIKEGKQNYIGNLIIAKKDIFDEYSSWLFDILFELEKIIQKDVIKRDAYQQRVYGFLAERLLGVFIAYKQETSNIRICEAPLVFVESDTTKYIKYLFRQAKRRFLTLIGLKKKEWYYYVS